MSNASRSRLSVIARERMRQIRRELTRIYRAFPDLALQEHADSRRRALSTSDDRAARRRRVRHTFA